MWYGKGFNDGDGEPPRPKKQEQKETGLTACYSNKDNDESLIGSDDDDIIYTKDNKSLETISFEKLYQEIDKKESELHDMDGEGHIWWHKFRNFLKDIQNGK